MSKKGDAIKNKCHNCYNETMIIYRVSKSISGKIVWCKCPVCGAVDDIISYK